jgi:hypothetical protein
MCLDLSLPQPSTWQGPKQRSLEISACVPFVPFCSMSSGLAYCWVHSHTGFESVTSTNSAKAALKAIVEMQVSADRTKTNDAFSFDDFIDQSSSSSKLIDPVGHHKLIELINGFGCHIKLFKLSKLIVNLFLNPNYTRAHAVPITSYSNLEGEWGHCAHENYSHFNDDHLLRLIVNSDSEGAQFGLSKSQTTLRNKESKLIVATDSINADTKISFTFFNR